MTLDMELDNARRAEELILAISVGSRGAVGESFAFYRAPLSRAVDFLYKRSELSRTVYQAEDILKLTHDRALSNPEWLIPTLPIDMLDTYMILWMILYGAAKNTLVEVVDRHEKLWNWKSGLITQLAAENGELARFARNELRKRGFEDYLAREAANEIVNETFVSLAAGGQGGVFRMPVLYGPVGPKQEEWLRRVAFNNVKHRTIDRIRVESREREPRFTSVHQREHYRDSIRDLDSDDLIDWFNWKLSLLGEDDEELAHQILELREDREGTRRHDSTIARLTGRSISEVKRVNKLIKELSKELGDRHLPFNLSRRPLSWETA